MRILTRLSQISSSSHRGIFLISGWAGAGAEYEEERLMMSRVQGVATGEYQAVAVLGRTTSTIAEKLLASGSHHQNVNKYLEMHRAVWQ